MEIRTIEQTVTFKASPHDVYEALMDSGQHAKFTGAPAEISRDVGGSFTAYGGVITGTHVELVPDRKIVQSWRIQREGWPPDHDSTITVSLAAADGGTRLSLVQTGVPEACFSSISVGWQEHYWDKMREMLDG